MLHSIALKKFYHGNSINKYFAAGNGQNRKKIYNRADTYPIFARIHTLMYPDILQNRISQKEVIRVMNGFIIE